MISKDTVKAGLIVLILHAGAVHSSRKISVSRDGTLNRQIFYDDTHTHEYQQQHLQVTQEIPPYRQPQLPPELSLDYNAPSQLQTSPNRPIPSYNQPLPGYVLQEYSQPQPLAPAPQSYAAPAYAPPYAPPAPVQSYAPPPQAYAPASPPAAYPVQTYGETNITPAQTGYDSYLPDGYGSDYGGGYEASYEKGYKKPYKHKEYHDVLGMKKYYYLKVFGGLLKAKGAVLVGIGKVLKFKGKLLLAKGEALEEIGYQLKDIKYKANYGYGYDGGYDGHKEKGHKHKGHKHKGHKKPPKGYGVPYDEGYDDYRRKGTEGRPVDLTANGSEAFQQVNTEQPTSSQGPPIPLVSAAGERATKSSIKLNNNYNTKAKEIKPSASVKPQQHKGETGLQTFKGSRHVSTTSKPKYSVPVTNKGIKLRTTERPKVSMTVKTETGFQPMFDYDSSGETSEQRSSLPVKDGWSPVKFY